MQPRIHITYSERLIVPTLRQESSISALDLACSCPREYKKETEETTKKKEPKHSDHYCALPDHASTCTQNSPGDGRDRTSACMLFHMSTGMREDRSLVGTCMHLADGGADLGRCQTSLCRDRRNGACCVDDCDVVYTISLRS